MLSGKCFFRSDLCLAEVCLLHGEAPDRGTEASPVPLGEPVTGGKHRQVVAEPFVSSLEWGAVRLRSDAPSRWNREAWSDVKSTVRDDTHLAADPSSSLAAPPTWNVC